MSKNYDNWERLVTAVLRKEWDKQLALSHSRDPSTISSTSSSFLDLSFSSRSQFDDDDDNSESMTDHKTMVPPDEHEVVWRSAYLCLCLDKRTGKNCFMLGARELIISWGDKSLYWKWTSHADSRFSTVAELEFVLWLDIRGKIKTRILSPKTIYAAFLVFKLAEGSEGLEVANAMIRFPDDESDENAEKRARIVHLQTVGSKQEQIAVLRADGWMEIEMGYFYVDQGDQREVEARLLENTTLKTGLIVEGIEFRPKFEKKQVTKEKERGEGRRRFFKP
ncbi:hypothetical protein DH2020_023977 [Rehmannia glutinosa]|uniref:F-box protein n=1 Tax=Rehmannia glutinosa TaxID=99300 RepID=A0ABR0WC07_REHGL